MNKILQKCGLDTKNSTFIIAEAGINHGGDLNVAIRLIESAARAGADAVKFQTYLTEKRCPANRPDVFRILKKCELPFDHFRILKDHAEKCGIIFFSTPFDEDSVDYLESINCEIYKIASFDISNIRLVEKVAKTGKAVLLSVGMAEIAEIKKSYGTLKKGTDKISILHCISSYPTEEFDAHLANIRVLIESFDCVIGQSDHTNEINVPLYSVAAGAQVLEKHFRLNAHEDCVDASVSIDENQMTKLVKEVRRLEKILGEPRFGVRNSERSIIPFRRTTT